LSQINAPDHPARFYNWVYAHIQAHYVQSSVSEDKAS
jgi:hypothetical protein